MRWLLSLRFDVRGFGTPTRSLAGLETVNSTLMPPICGREGYVASVSRRVAVYDGLCETLTKSIGSGHVFSLRNRIEANSRSGDFNSKMSALQ